MRSGLWYTLVVLAVAAAVAGVGTALEDGPGRTAVWMGVGIATFVQLAAFWLLFVLLLPGQPVLAHGLGMLGRLGTVVLVALLGLPLSGVPAAPTLFSLVAVLFVTTLCEPVILQVAKRTRR